MDKEIKIAKYLVGFMLILAIITALTTHKEKPLPVYKVVTHTYNSPRYFKEYPKIIETDNSKPFIYVEPTDPQLDEVMNRIEDVSQMVEDGDY